MKILIILFCFVIGLSAHAQTANIHKGVNIESWLSPDSANKIIFRQYSKQEFANIQSLGCDVVRLPINFAVANSATPNTIISPILFQILDSVIDWSENLKLYVILEAAIRSQTPYLEANLNNIWSQMAKRYSTKSKYIIYEILNEPNGISAATWGTIQGNVINTIRKYDTNHTIVVSGNEWSSLKSLSLLPLYSDKNLLYTFHFYTPMLFTHQGAPFLSPALDLVTKIPFPYETTKMPLIDSSYLDTWVEDAYLKYPQEGTYTLLKTLIDKAVQFRTTRNVPIYCGEFGVMQGNCLEVDRLRWIDTVVSMLNTNNIPWTTWNYRGSDFGLYPATGFKLFNHHLNLPLLDELGFTKPSQTTFAIKPESKGRIIYDDFLGEQIAPIYLPHKVNYFYNKKVKNGTFCIKWSNITAFNRFLFDFIPNKDFSALKNQNFALNFWVRANALCSFDVAFSDTKEAINDHPWKVSFTINDKQFKGDKQWHKVQIPLNKFIETGCWDSVWLNPQGKFNWSLIDKFEILTKKPITDTVWFDDISIVSTDSTISPPQDTTGYINPQFNCAKAKQTANAYSKINSLPISNTKTISNIYLGDTLILGQTAFPNAHSRWIGPNEYTIDTCEISINNIAENQFGTYIVSTIINNSCIISDTFLISPKKIVQTINFANGKTLVSLYVQPPDPRISTLFKYLNPAEIKSNELFWKRNQRKQYNLLTTMKGGSCYEITMNVACTLYVGGIAVRTQLNKATPKSWQMFGCSFAQKISFADVFKLSGCTQIKNLNASWMPGGLQNATQFLELSKAYYYR